MSFFELFQTSGAAELEIIRLVYEISLLISLWVYYEREHSPGGIITAGSVLLLLGNPLRILFMFLTTAIIIPVHSVIERRILKNHILVTREKMLLRVFISISVSAILFTIFGLIFDIRLGLLGTVGPALLAGGLSRPDRRKQVIISFLYAVIIGILTYLIVKFVYVYFVPGSYVHFINNVYERHRVFDFWSVLVMYLLFGSITIYNFFAGRARVLAPVGMMIGGYLGILILQPLQIIFILLVVLISSVIVRNVDRFALLYGYRIFVLSSLVSASIYIILEMSSIIFLNFYPLKGITLGGIVVASVMTNELAQNVYSKVLLSYTSMFLFSGILFLITYAVANFVVGGEVALLPSVYRQFIFNIN